jgi:hypothetical protein
VRKKLFLAAGFAALTSACVPAGNPNYYKPAIAVVAPDYAYGYAYYRPWGYGRSFIYQPYFPSFAHRHPHYYRSRLSSAHRHGGYYANRH